MGRLAVCNRPPPNAKFLQFARGIGASLAQVQAQAAQRGYGVSSLIDGRAFVHEPRSFGRFICDVQFGSNGLVSSVYKFND